MIISESAFLSLSRAIVTKAATLWLNDRAKEKEKSSSLLELIRARSRDRFMGSDLARQVEAMVDGVARRLEPFRTTQLQNMPDNERLAAALAVTDLFKDMDFGDSALFATDVNQSELTRQMRDEMTIKLRSAALSPDAEHYADRLLAECCDCYVRMVIALHAFPPRALAETLSRLSTIGDTVAEVLRRMPTPTLDAPSGRGFDDEFRRRYLEHVSNYFNKVEMFGVDLPYRMVSTLSVAYLPLGAVREASISPVGKQVDGERVQTVRVEEILDGSPRVLLRGEAGSGKTTLLKWIAVSAARGALTGHLAKYNGHTPLLVPLRRYADRDFPNPDQLLDRSTPTLAGLAPQGWIRRQLLSKRTIVMIDGIDEVSAPRRHEVKEWLEDFLASYPNARIIVTTRPAAAAADWLNSLGFVPARLEPMKIADLRRFVAQWHEAAAESKSLPCDPGELPKYRSLLLARFSSNLRLRLLATTPLLCAMLCALNLGHRGQLPRNRMEIYDAALRMLLTRRELERDSAGTAVAPGLLQYIDVPQQRSLLRDIAWRIAAKEEAQASKARVVDWMERKLSALIATVGVPSMDARPALIHLLERSGVLREPEPGVIDFIHRTFLEYLAAEEAAEQDYMDLIVEHAHMDTWHEIAILAAGHANKPLTEELLTGLLRRAERGSGQDRTSISQVLVRCLETVTDVSPALRSRLEEQAQALIPPMSREDARHVGAGGTAVLRFFPSDLSGLTEESAAATVTAAAIVNGNAAVELLSQYVLDARASVRDAILDCWALFDAEEYVKRVLSENLAHESFLEVTTPMQAHAARARFPGVGLRLVTDEVGFRSLQEYPPLRALAAYGPVGDLKPIADQPELTHVWFSDLSRIDDYSFFRQLRDLEEVTLLNARHLINLAVLRDARSLHKLSLGGLRNRANLRPLVSISSLVVVLDKAVTPMNTEGVNVSHMDLSREAGSFPKQF
jgi:hypothetical protein